MLLGDSPKDRPFWVEVDRIAKDGRDRLELQGYRGLWRCDMITDMLPNAYRPGNNIRSVHSLLLFIIMANWLTRNSSLPSCSAVM